MAEQQLVLDLAKLLIAAAWADGELSNQETNALKDLLFGLENITGRQWAALDMFIETPVSAEETDALLASVLQKVKTDEDKELVVSSVEKLVAADGIVTEEELNLLEQVKQSISEINTGTFAKLSEKFKALMGRRKEKIQKTATRQISLDDYIKNKIYYDFKKETEAEGKTIEISPEKVKKLTLAAGMLSRIAAVDSGISEEEQVAIEKILQKEWNLSEDEANFVTRVSCCSVLKGIDYFRLARGFFESTTYEQRKEFLKCLFAVANVSEKTSFDETEEIREIANSLKLSHSDFIEAKLTISDEDREVL